MRYKKSWAPRRITQIRREFGDGEGASQISDFGDTLVLFGATIKREDYWPDRRVLLLFWGYSTYSITHHGENRVSSGIYTQATILQSIVQ